MRRMLERISPVLLVVVMVGGFVIMSSLPATAEAPHANVGHAHAVRPIAATNSPAPAVAVEEPAPEPEPVVPEDPAPPVQQSWSNQSVSNPPPASSCDGDVNCFLECTKAHESDEAGGYEAVSGGGGYRGAYQFSQQTWDAAVAGVGLDQYVGVPADQVPAEAQDAAAAHLYSVEGNGAWGGRC